MTTARRPLALDAAAVFRSFSRARPDLLVHAGVAVFLALVFVPFALLRLIDSDEGLYLLYGRYVAHGLVPYHDFPLGQTPLLVYVYGLWGTLVGFSWYSGRLLAGLLVVVLGLALYRHVAIETGRQVWGVAAAVALASSSMAFAWFPLIKTHGLAILMLFLAYTSVVTAPPRWRYPLSGFFLGLAVDTRYYLIVIAPLIALEAWRTRTRLADSRAPARSTGEASLRVEIGRFAVGLLIGLVPSLVFLLIDAKTYIFNIIGTHAVTADEGLIGGFDEKFGVLRDLLGLQRSFGVATFQFAILIVMNVCLLTVTLLGRERIRLSVAISAAIIVVSMMPTPTFVQYFSLAIPFLIVDAITGVVRLVERAEGGGDMELAQRLTHGFAALLALYVLAGPIDMYGYVAGGSAVFDADTPAKAYNWKIETVRRVGRAVDEAMPPAGGTVISWWPGYFVETRAEVFPKLRNPWPIWYAHRLTPEDIARYRLPTHGEVMANIEAHTVPIVVVGNSTFGARDQVRGIVLQSGYRLVTRIGDAEIYRVGDGQR